MHLENSAKIAYKKLNILIRFFAWVLLAFFEIKHKIDLDAIYFKLHSIIIKFPTQEISIERSGSSTYVPNDILRGICL